jgi:hypothetical protein
MTHASSTDNVLHWTLDESRAIFRGDGIQLDVTPHEPHCGGTARLKDDGGTQANAHLFQLRWPWRSEVGSDPVAEAYVRQRDLVITYEQRPPRTVRPQTYWRVFPIDAVHGMALEYVLSLQTDRLASEPRVASSALCRTGCHLAHRSAYAHQCAPIRPRKPGRYPGISLLHGIGPFCRSAREQIEEPGLDRARRSAD